MSTRLLPEGPALDIGGRNWLSMLRIYLVVSVVLHLAWEVVQLPLYTIWSTGTAGGIAFAVLHCTAGDVMIATLVLVTALVAFGNKTWPETRFRPVAAAVVSLGASYTIYSEWLNTVVRKSWAYADIMPTLPVLGTGLSPLLQWLIIPAVALWAAARPCTSPERARTAAEKSPLTIDRKMH